MSIRDMRHTTVEDVLALRQAAIEMEEKNAALAAHLERLSECISDGNEMLGELRKKWQKNMPKSALDVQDQIDLGERLVAQPPGAT